MTTLRIQVTLHNDSGLPVDNAMNTWHVESLEVDRLVGAAAAVTALDAFYLEVQAIFSSALDGNLTFDVYDLNDAVPRTVILNSTSIITPDTSPRLPNECAIALSYHSQQVSGSVAARNRGRIFLGPITSDTVTAGTGDTRVTTTARELISDAAATFMNAGSPTSWQWSVFSPTTAGPPPWTSGEILAATKWVIGGHVDDAFDTIRSRGTAPSGRSSFSA